MFSKLAFVASLAVLAVATPTPLSARGDCDTGSIQCCNSVQSSADPSVSSLLGLLGVVVGGVNVPVGLQCNPISVIGIGSSGCKAAPVCCENNSFNGLIALGCLPISLDL